MTHKLILVQQDTSTTYVEVLEDEFHTIGRESFDNQSETKELFEFIGKYTSKGPCVIEFSWIV